MKSNESNRTMTIRIGSRKSPLAMWQTRHVLAKLNRAGIAATVVPIETQGDRVLDRAIAKIGSKGVFTEALEEQLASGAIDIAVHSAKDMPSLLPEGFALIAYTERASPEDCLVSFNKGLRLGNPGQAVTIGTSSVRRQALLRRHYPQVQTVELRGNLQTRIQKMEAGLCDGIVMARAGLQRMGMEALILQTLPVDDFFPPVGQGCIAVEASIQLDPEKRERLRACINHRESETCLLAERAFLRQLEGGCAIPAFALARIAGGMLTLSAGLMGLDGRDLIAATETGPCDQAAAAGHRLGARILKAGGSALLAQIRQQQEGR
jgi:hydroxymethylbilane synthase